MHSKERKKDPLRTTFDDLGFVAEIRGDVGGAAGAEGIDEDAVLLVGIELDGRDQIGDPHAPLAGAEQHLHQMPGGEAPPAGHHAPPLAAADFAHSSRDRR